MSDEANAPDATDGPQEALPPVWRRVASSAEGKVLLAGVLLLGLYITALLMVRARSPKQFGDLWAMTTTHVLGGRAAGLTLGYQFRLAPRLVILCNMVIETFMVLLFYPLFVFSYRRLIVIQPLEDTMARARQAAETHQRSIMKLGVPGLLVFVWFPFWMTGPVIGSIIGFLIGLNLWVNLTVVLAGTYLAILCWGIVLHRLHASLTALGYYVPVAFVGLILLIAVSIHIRYAFAKPQPRAPEPPDEPGAPS